MALVSLGAVGVPAAQAAFTFSQASYSVGSVSSGWPEGVAAADLNGDGHVDVAVANNGGPEGTISVLLGDGHGTLGAASELGSGGDSAEDVAAADFDGDGKLDLVAANSSGNNVGVLRGNGGGTFATAAPYATGAVPREVAVGDFNEDGSPDLATTDSGSGSVSVLLNRHDGTGTFNARTGYSTSHAPWAITAADVTGDGHLDLLVGEPGSTSNVELLEGNGHGAFASVGVFPLATGGGNLQGAMGVGDLNGDGRPDVAASGWDGGTLSVLINSGSGGAGAFGSATSYSTGYGTETAQIGDFDLDGKRDVAIASRAGSSVGVLGGDGAGGLGSVQGAGGSSNPGDLKIADFNEDGRPDIVTAAGGSKTADVFLNTSPVPADAPRASTGGTAHVADHAATLLGIVDAHGLHTTYHFEYGTTTSYGATGSPTPEQDAGSDNGDTVGWTDIAGLAPSTTYHYRLVAQNLGGTTYGADRTFHTASNTPPDVTTLPASFVAQTYMTLVGNIDTHGVSGGSYRFEWGEVGGPMDNVSATLPASDGYVSKTLTNLEPGRQYRYRLVVTEGGVDYPAPEVQWSTHLPFTEHLMVPAAQITATTAQASVQVETRGDKVSLAFRAHPDNGPDIVTPTVHTSGSCLIVQGDCSQVAPVGPLTMAGLQPGTRYHLTVELFDASGNPVTLSHDAATDFTTPPVTPPDVRTLGSSEVAQTSLTISGSIDTHGQPGESYRFEWGEVGSPMDNASATLPASDGMVDKKITNLRPGGQYRFRLVVTENGVDYPAPEAQWSTHLPSTQHLTVPAAQITTTTAQASVQVETRGDKISLDLRAHPDSGPDIVTTTVHISGFCQQHISDCSQLAPVGPLTMAGLQPGTRYHLTVELLDASGDPVTLSHDAATDFTTQPKPPSTGNSALVHGNTAGLSVFCPDRIACSGQIQLQPVTTGATASARHAAKVLGRARFAVPAGKRKTVGITLNKAGRSLVRRRGQVTVLAVTTMRSPSGGTNVVSRHRLTLKVAKHR